MTTIVTVKPTVEPVTLPEAKAQCRVDGSDDDSLITSLIVAARESAEHETGRAICTQTRELVLDSFGDSLVLGASVQSVTSVKYIDTNGTEQTLSSTEYRVNKDSTPGVIDPAYGKSWPSTLPVSSAVRVAYVCGYGAASAVPESIKQWIKLAVATMYAQRETVSDGQLVALPDRFWHRLLDPHRTYEM